MKKFFEKLLSLIFPSGLSCILCRKELAEANRKCVCEECEAKLPYIVHPCERCGEEVIGEGRFCEACKYVKRDFDKCYSVFNYADKAKDLVYKLKYENAKYLAEYMAKYLSDMIVSGNIEFDMLTFVPVCKNRKRSRGYNQAQLLAENVARDMKVECLNLLDRTKERPSQVKLDFKERLENIKDDFVVRDDANVNGKVVLIIDDVITTGATINECAKILKKAGASKVIGLTFANTPRAVDFEESTKSATKSKQK